jgi:hypothetical protein
VYVRVGPALMSAADAACETSTAENSADQYSARERRIMK